MDWTGSVINAVNSRIAPLQPQLETSEIFHYTSVAGMQGILSQLQFHATEVHYLNDPSEPGKNAAEILEKAFPLITDPFRKEILTKIREFVHEQQHDISDFRCVVSFCSDPDIVSQWRGYSGGALGYALGFDLKKLRSSLPPYCSLMPVEYILDNQVSRLISSLDAALELRRSATTVLCEEDIFKWFAGLTYSIITQFETMKPFAFRDEREVRIIFNSLHYREDVHQHLRFRRDANHLIPYVHVPFAAASLNRIIIQNRPEAISAMAGLELFLKQHRLPIRIEIGSTPSR